MYAKSGGSVHALSQNSELREEVPNRVKLWFTYMRFFPLIDVTCIVTWTGILWCSRSSSLTRQWKFFWLRLFYRKLLVELKNSKNKFQRRPTHCHHHRKKVLYTNTVVSFSDKSSNSRICKLLWPPNTFVESTSSHYHQIPFCANAFWSSIYSCCK